MNRNPFALKHAQNAGVGDRPGDVITLLRERVAAVGSAVG